MDSRGQGSFRCQCFTTQQHRPTISCDPASLQRVACQQHVSARRTAASALAWCVAVAAGESTTRDSSGAHSSSQDLWATQHLWQFWTPCGLCRHTYAPRAVSIHMYSGLSAHICPQGCRSADCSAEVSVHVCPPHQQHTLPGTSADLLGLLIQLRLQLPDLCLTQLELRGGGQRIVLFGRTGRPGRRRSGRGRKNHGAAAFGGGDGNIAQLGLQLADLRLTPGHACGLYDVANHG